MTSPSDTDGMRVRAFEPEDAEATLRIFERAVRITARGRYTQSQVTAWLGGSRELVRWRRDRELVSTFVAERSGQAAGFTDVSDEGYVDMLFVDPDHGRRGVANALVRHVATEAESRGIVTLTTHASLLARPVFEANGYRVTARETVVRGSERLERFRMVRALGDSTTGDPRR